MVFNTVFTLHPIFISGYKNSSNFINPLTFFQFLRSKTGITRQYISKINIKAYFSAVDGRSGVHIT